MDGEGRVLGLCGTEVCELAAPMKTIQRGKTCVKSKAEDREGPPGAFSITLGPAQEGVSPALHSLLLVSSFWEHLPQNGVGQPLGVISDLTCGPWLVGPDCGLEKTPVAPLSLLTVLFQQRSGLASATQAGS